MSFPQTLRCRIDGIGVWGPGFSSWPELRACFRGDSDLDDNQPPGPKPEIIPANERRRAPLPVRLAVETSWQACQQADIEPATLNSVFSSAFGDIDITDYMCTTLNTEAKQLSPTKFHNSVHNAPAGYWTISTGCMRPTNAVAGFKSSASVTLLEAMAQATTSQQSMLLTFCDPPAKGALIPVLVNTYGFSASIIITPINALPTDDTRPTLGLDIVTEKADWPALAIGALNPLYRDNPSARVLSVLETLAGNRGTTTLKLPLSSATSLALEIHY